jgi:hypothetical protein
MARGTQGESGALGAGAIPPPPSFVPAPVPDKRLAGVRNDEHYRVRIANLNGINEHNQLYHGTLLKGYKQSLDGILLEFKLDGGNVKDLLDDRSEAQRMDETVDRLLDSPPELWATLDTEIDIVEKAMRRSVDLSHEYLQAKQEKLDDDFERRGHDPGREQAVKTWLSRLERVRRLRSWAREEVPKKADHKRAHAWRASHLARFMIYVFRSDLSDNTGPGGDILEMAPHHAKIFCDLWMARRRIKLYPKDHPRHPQGGPKAGVTDCRGIIIVCPPRHSKTQIGAAFVTLSICQNPRLQCKLGHAIEDKATENLGLIKQCFDPGNARGRRCLSLFPHELDKKGNNARKMRIKLKERTKNSTATADGIMSGVGGTNADIIWPDDPVDPKAVNEETYRNKNHMIFTQQWLTRFQGAEPFLIMTLTLWHEDDTGARMIQGAIDKKLPFAVSTQAVGGPHTSPPFRALWDRYPAHRLRQIYNQMADPSGWAAQYQANPNPESLRIVKKVALFLSSFGDFARPTSCDARDCGVCHQCQMAQHREFMRQATFDLSVDPAATNTVKSDMAGLLWAGVGDLVRVVRDEHGQERKSRRVIRILEGREFHATQSEMVEHVGDYMQMGHKVHRLHVETVSGFAATAEMFSNRYGVEVIRHTPRNQNKTQRLKNVAPMVDASLEAHGLPPPVVEFPGQLDADGTLVPIPGMDIPKVLYQILNAGNTGKAHFLDCFTQFLRFHSGDIGVGEFELSAQVVAVRELQSTGRPKRFDGQRVRLNGEERPKLSAPEEELAWLMR